MFLFDAEERVLDKVAVGISNDGPVIDVASSVGHVDGHSLAGQVAVAPEEDERTGGVIVVVGLEASGIKKGGVAEEVLTAIDAAGDEDSLFVARQFDGSRASSLQELVDVGDGLKAIG